MEHLTMIQIKDLLKRRNDRKGTRGVYRSIVGRMMFGLYFF